MDNQKINSSTADVETWHAASPLSGGANRNSSADMTVRRSRLRLYKGKQHHRNGKNNSTAADVETEPAPSHGKSPFEV